METRINELKRIESDIKNEIFRLTGQVWLIQLEINKQRDKDAEFARYLRTGKFAKERAA